MIPFAAAALLAWAALAGPTATEPVAASRWHVPASGLSARAAQPDHWLAEDKLRHFVASFGGFNLAFGALRTGGLERAPALVGATALVGAAGLWKEWRDRRAGGPFSVKDLVWDGLGILAGVAVAANTR